MINLHKIDAALHSIEIKNGANTLAIDGAGAINVATLTGITNDVNIADGGNSITVDDGGATLSIDDGGGTITIDGTITGITNDVNIADGGNSITVDDGGGSITVDGSVSTSQAALNTAQVISNQVVDTTVGGVQLLASQQAGRVQLMLQNFGGQDVWLKNGTGVTAGETGNGFLLAKGTTMEQFWGDSFDFYGITASSSSNVKIVETK